MQVTFPLSGAEAYMTASSGEFGNPFKSSCPNQVVAAAGADFVGKEYVDSYIVDCSETGNITITVTWSRTKTDNYHQSSITLPVNVTCMLDYCEFIFLFLGCMTHHTFLLACTLPTLSVLCLFCDSLSARLTCTAHSVLSCLFNIHEG